MHNKSPRNIVGQGDCPRVVGTKPKPFPSGQSRKLPHIRIQLKESNKIQKSIRDVLVPRSHYKLNTEGTYGPWSPEIRPLLPVIVLGF